MSILGLGAKQSAPVIMQAPNPPTPTDPNVVAAADAARQAQAQAAGRGFDNSYVRLGRYVASHDRQKDRARAMSEGDRRARPVMSDFDMNAGANFTEHAANPKEVARCRCAAMSG